MDEDKQSLSSGEGKQSLPSDEGKEDLLKSEQSEQSQELEESELTDSAGESNEPNEAEESDESQHSTFSNLSNSGRSSDTSYYATEKKKSRKLTLILIIVAILLIAGGFFIYKKKFSKHSQVAPTQSPTPTTTTATPNPLVRSEWSFEVLNGSGVTGLAKKISEKLQALGYKVIKTGNADKDNYDKTQILVKKELQGKIDLVIADLKDVIKIASVAGELKDSTASARIIIGKE